MRTRAVSRASREGGYALIMVMVVLAICVTILAATLGRTNTVESLNARNNNYTAGLYAAEAATEKALARMQWDYLAGNLTYVTNDLSTYRTSVPTVADDPYWGGFQYSDGQGHLNQLYIQCISNTAWSALQSQYAGLNGWVTTYRVLANASQVNSRYPITNAVQQDIQLYGIPLFQFAIFYNSLLEFTWCAPFTINGRTHCNTNIFVGSASALTFNSTVTAGGTLTAPAWFGKTVGQYSAAVTYNGSPGYSTNAQTLTLPIGTNNSAASVREVINMPPSGEDPSSPMGQQRYYNKAEIIIMINNTNVVTTLRTSTNDASPIVLTSSYNPTNFAATNFYAIATNFPFLSLTNNSADHTNSGQLLTFTDQREGKTILATQIDMNQLTKWVATNSAVNSKFPNSAGVYNNGTFPNVMYVSDNRTTNSTTLTAIRLKGGLGGAASVVPTNMSPSGLASGFTVATPNPLYVWGNYNCPDSSALNTTNTSKTFPCSLVADALTILSGNWNDSQSTLNLGTGGKNAATSTTVNAAILTGIVFTTGSDVNSFSGGVMNLPRLLEDWSSVTFTLNTSIVNLFNSVRATTQFQAPGIYYSAPQTRKFSFDPNFMNQGKLPPGTPILGSILRSKWSVPPPDSVTYAGN